VPVRRSLAVVHCELVDESESDSTIGADDVPDRICASEASEVETAKSR
jgi:hypothetical protein